MGARACSDQFSTYVGTSILIPSTYLKIRQPLRQSGSWPDDMQMPCVRSIRFVRAVTPSVDGKRQFRVFGHSPCVKTRWTQSLTKDSFGQVTIPHRKLYRHVCATVVAPDVQTKRSVAEKLAWVQTTTMVNFAALQLCLANTKCIGTNICRHAVTLAQAVLTSAVESGINTFLFPARHQHLAQEWKGVVDFDALLCDGDAIRADNQQVFCHC